MLSENEIDVKWGYNLRMPQIELDTFEDYEAVPVRGSGGGGKKRPVFGEKGRQKKKLAEGKSGQLAHRQEARSGGEKSPTEEVNNVLSYIATRDEGKNDMPALTTYLKWVERNIDSKEIELQEAEMSNWEKFTASVHAGGSGRQTSRNARARTHLITGIRERSEIGRKAFECERDVMEKIKTRLETHLANLRILIDAKKGEKVDVSKLEEDILSRITKL